MFMKNVSYIYVTHTLDSGLATFHKKRGELTSDLSSASCTEADVGVSLDSLDSIQNWRQELQTDQNEILLERGSLHS